MRFNSVRTSDYSQSAKAVNKATDQIFDAAMSGKPDFTKISQEAIKGRSLERRTATDAEGHVAKAGLDAIRKTKITRMKADTEKEVSDIKRPAKRMAGIVAGLGAIGQAAVLHKENKLAKKEREEFRAEEKALWARSEQMHNESMAKWQELIENNKRPGGTEGVQQPEAPTVPDPVVPSSTDTSPAPEASSTSTPKPPSTSTPTVSTPRIDGEGTGMRYMRHLTSNGFSPTQAAAMVGHLDYESDGFRAMEEYGPNRLGTKGYGHLQWTNIPGNFKPGGQRRTDFENWAKNHGLDASSFEANSGFLLHEFNDGQGVWTGGGSAKNFYTINDLSQASDYLRNNYTRPSAGSEAERLRRSQQYLSQFQSLNS